VELSDKEGNNMQNNPYKEKIESNIQDGFVIFAQPFMLRGTNHHIAYINEALNGKGQIGRTFLKYDKDNEYDDNAIKVFITKKRTFFKTFTDKYKWMPTLTWSTNFPIGYLPREMAYVLTRYKLGEKLTPSVRSIYRYPDGNRTIVIDLTGPAKLYFPDLIDVLDDAAKSLDERELE
jgi:hypothetical protein